METKQFYTGTELEKAIVITNHYKRYQPEVEIAQKDSLIEEKIAPYIPSDELVQAVNYARLLKRPLLLRGEPGCGKTKLAQALAYEIFQKLGDNENDNYRNHFFEWHIKSTSKAIDGIYTFDHIGRLRDSQLLSTLDKQSEEYKKLINKKVKDYRIFGPLGNAFLSSKESYPSVLLIDEIDKADIDFPNDLLLELDQKRFFIEETNEEYAAEESPIIIITSNDERELPDAFLRRCVFHYIDFLSEEKLKEILRGRSVYIQSQLMKTEEITENKYQKLLESKIDNQQDIIAAVVKKFLDIRSKAETNPNISKLPSTSELIDWYQIIHYNILFHNLNINEDLDTTLLFPDVLFKKLSDSRISRGFYK